MEVVKDLNEIEGKVFPKEITTKDLNFIFSHIPDDITVTEIRLNISYFMNVYGFNLDRGSVQVSVNKNIDESCNEYITISITEGTSTHTDIYKGERSKND